MSEERRGARNMKKSCAPSFPQPQDGQWTRCPCKEMARRESANERECEASEVQPTLCVERRETLHDLPDEEHVLVRTPLLPADPRTTAAPATEVSAARHAYVFLLPVESVSPDASESLESPESDEVADIVEKDEVTERDSSGLDVQRGSPRLRFSKHASMRFVHTWASVVSCERQCAQDNQWQRAAYTVDLAHVALRFVPECPLELIGVKVAFAELRVFG